MQCNAIRKPNPNANPEATHACLSRSRRRAFARRHLLALAMAVAVAGSMLSLGVRSAEAQGGLRPGDAAPDFTLLDVDENAYTLSELRGNVVLLAFVGWG